MDSSDLGLANSLLSRYLAYQAALALKDPKIIAFTLEGESEVEESGEASTETNQTTVSAEGIATPPQMLTGIKAQIEARLKAIEDELGKLGVTV